MHCNQPLCGNGYSYGPHYNNCTPPIQCGGVYPEIIGEGDITSVTLPDGTVQFLFSPSVDRCTRHPLNASNAYNMNSRGPFMNANTGVWLIRSIRNPIPASAVNPAYQRYQQPRPWYETDCNFNAYNNGFQIKFHNDTCTSTTDIYYFYPSLRRYECCEYARPPPSKICAAVQVEAPVKENTIHHYICANPCKCVPMQCHATVASNDSNMSIENRSKDNLKHSSSRESQKGKEDDASRDRKKGSKSTNVVSEHDKSAEVSRVDRSVTTYADNASSCAPAGGRETQTCANPAPVVKKDLKKGLKVSNVQTEKWYPKTPASKKVIENIKIIGLSSSCSSNCSCRSDTE